jgi:predicted RNA-binding protein YlxR (DUF448 family)
MLADADKIETDPGPGRLRPGAERLCVATRTVRPVAQMIRFVIGPDGEVVPDLKRRLPGRGLWVTAERHAVADAVRRKAFARSFRREVEVAPTLPAMVERLLERAALDALSIAYKAGQVVAGFGRAAAALDAAATVIALIHASDAGSDGVRKLAAAARRRFGEAVDRLVVVDGFACAQLDLALGRPHVIHAALLAGSASEEFLARCRSLEHFRADEPNGPEARARS